MNDLSGTPVIAPTVIHRADYRPPEWLVPEIALDFALSLNATRVQATLTVAKNPAGSGTAQLRLNGDGLEAKAVTVDGQAHNDWHMDGTDLVITLPGDAHAVGIETLIDPAANTQLSGLYASNGLLCTQCEAEGFRRITFFPDRPDVLSVYSVRMSGDKAQFPVLLSNGNPTASGDGPDGTHWAEWHDPWPKPSYLFALVAGELIANRDSFTTMSGRKVNLAIYVRPGDESRTDHAMRSLIASMKWDEDVYGREYDLDDFNIVAVSDFNAGAMENKGLNVFNTRYILADPETATEGDYDAIEGVVAHEYFHNWSGNRVTCRDWFQLSLKEGFTVLRDQQFSADRGSPPVKRIEDVRILRAAQFPEDSGPLAHPIRPDSYQEISNFYTATVYNKGAEVIRMMTVMAGMERFLKGTTLYFDRHDGEAATCEDFVKAIEDGAGLDLTQFRRWYEQAGTPKVTVTMALEGTTLTLTLTQSMAPTPGQMVKQPMVIPLRTALFDQTSGTHRGEELLVLTQPQQTFTFEGFDALPVLSINRGFSAPVEVTAPVTADDLVFLARHDDDPFARYEAMQQLIVRHLVGAVAGTLEGREASQAAIGAAMGAILDDTALDDLMRGELLILPGEAYLAEQLTCADPTRIFAEREGLKRWLGETLKDKWLALHDGCSAVPYSLEAAARGARKCKTQALVYLAAADPAEAARRAKAQYDAATNMTDRQGALMVLCSLNCPEREAALADFHARFEGNMLVTDKWFSLQAGSLNPNVTEHVKALAAHPDFTLTNPNRVRALWMAYAVNAQGFHREGGEGYRLIADLILKLDPINGNVAARFVPPLGRWKKVDETRAALMRAELERIAAEPSLSKDVREQVTKSLEA
ncbi:MAG: aminopeptidase N [Novosphingobium sp. 28-62-57]|uniref:aminopeptidase N n=1 Tax=unclassified Novosphingobium TaxID=2644732 RepID=UPI000BC460AF|nr:MULTISPECIES: aminopeptidase N [unclassified Novosphingobium]OYW50437.1 MAG: aminopeptidase N [Novosphingobium sp. 12-62-10]OYZ11460.1 MAG: aminopeptidase N [Novosphingobium sp. 28-62-57]OZA37426.1 MAG: aminopeptidase N [Novosphingobium sp. 17-62-9]